MRADLNSVWPTLFITLALASSSAAISFYWWGRKSKSNSNGYADRIQELEAALKAAMEKYSGDRQGRTELNGNGTPRQPLLVSLARASLIFDLTRLPQASVEGLEGYSHCWIIYVFHLNTNLDKLWKKPSQSKFKAKVRVPRLKGENWSFCHEISTSSLPNWINRGKGGGHGHTVLLSGMDLVDGTPILDIKPYLPYCDSIPGATVPDWVKMNF